MARRNIIVVGASLGASEALPQLISGLPKDLAASVLVVQHMAPNAPSYLADRLSRAGTLQAAPAVDGERLEEGRIYVAVPDHHLMIEADRIRLSHGPKESHARPSVDVLFRSAAFAGGPRVIGVVLTGQLDDGTAGLWAIKDRGGLAIVQSPHDAAYPSMPQSALRHVKVDYTLAVGDISRILGPLTRESIQLRESVVNDKMEIETKIALGDEPLNGGVRTIGMPSFYTCPDCHGSMVAVEEGSIRRFKCHTGHGFSESSLLDRSLIRIEETLWSALAQIEERETLLRELAERTQVPRDTAIDCRTQADHLARMGQRVRELIE